MKEGIANFYTSLNIPFYLIPHNKEIIVEANLSVDVDPIDDFPISIYRVNIFAQNKLVCSFEINKIGDGGIGGVEVNKRRKKHLQMAIWIAEYIANCLEEKVKPYNSTIQRRVNSIYNIDNLCLPEGFIWN